MKFWRKQSAADLAGHSLDRMAWRRFRRNPLSVASLAVIGLFALVALLGYLITPDHTPHCNQQYLELATLKPGSKATFLYLDATGPLRRNMVRGTILPYTAIPINDYHYEDDLLHATPVAGEPLTVERGRVAEIKSRTFILGTDAYGRDVLSMLMIGSRVSLSVGFIALLIALLIGITLGALAAYHGGW
ncbi:MAG: hypothetical protein IKX32_05195, partial [Bacteroidales bacterium]|nr:hypothetical protein [Bacteroidales bacterium]